MLQSLRKIIDKITAAGGMLGGILFGLMALETFYSVFCRYVLRDPVFWNEEITRYILTWGTMAAMAFAMMKGRHIRTRILLDRVSPKMRVIMELTADIIALVLLTVFIWTSLSLTIDTFRIGKESITMLRFPLWIPQIALPIGGIFFFLQIVAKLMDDLILFRKEWISPGSEARG